MNPNERSERGLPARSGVGKMPPLPQPIHACEASERAAACCRFPACELARGNFDNARYLAPASWLGKSGSKLPHSKTSQRMPGGYSTVSGM
jgi:hypothetical protein